MKKESATSDLIVELPPAGEDKAQLALPLDKDGLPWDARIHSSNHQVTMEGVWRRKRGVSETLVATVEAELRGLDVNAAPAAPVAPPPPLPFPAPPPADDATYTVVAPLPAGAAPIPPPPAPVDFPAFMRKVAPLLAAGKLTQPQLLEAIKNAGLDSLPALAAPGNAAMIPVVEAFLRIQGHAVS